MCLQIVFKGADTGDLSGAILEDARYKRVSMSRTPYDRQLAARNNYDYSIAVENPLCRSKEENWAAGTRNQARKHTIECGANDYIINIVNKTWIHPMKDPDTFFTCFTPVQLLAQLCLAIRGLRRIDIFDLLVSLTQLWEQDPRFPEYPNALEDANKKSVRAGLPFLENIPAAIAISSLLNASSFPNDRPKWVGNLPAEQTFKSWQKFFLPLHQSLKRKKRVATGRGKVFGTTSSAVQIHSTAPSSMAGTAIHQGAPTSFIEQFDRHFGALASTATDINVVIKQLAATATTKYNQITASIAELKMALTTTNIRFEQIGRAS